MSQEHLKGVTLFEQRKFASSAHLVPVFGASQATFSDPCSLHAGFDLQFFASLIVDFPSNFLPVGRNGAELTSMLCRY